MEITVTPEECESESLTDTHLKQALDAIRTEGLVETEERKEICVVSSR